MIQCFFGRCENVVTTSFTLGTWTSPFNMDNFQGVGTNFATYAFTSLPISVPGTFRHLRAHMPEGPPIIYGAQVTLRIYITRAAAPTTLIQTDLAVTLVPGQFNNADISDSVHVDIGDTIAMRCREFPAIPGNVDLGPISHSLEFWSDNPNECIYGVAKGGTLNPVDGSSTGILTGQSDWDTDFTRGWNVFDTPGTLTRMDVLRRLAPGGAASCEYAIYKGAQSDLVATKQDGSGGTPDTRVTISGSATEGTALFTLAIIPGDWGYVQVDNIGGPVGSSVGLGFGWLSENDFDFPIAGQEGPLGTLGTGYYAPMQTRETIATGFDETIMVTPGPTTPMTMTGMRLRIGDAPGTVPTRSRTFTARNNFTTPAGTPTVTLSDLQVFGDAPGVLDLIGTDLWSVQEIRTNTPAQTNGTWAFTGSIIPEPPPECPGLVEAARVDGLPYSPYEGPPCEGSGTRSGSRTDGRPYSPYEPGT